jgi:hypothetical protein
VSQTSSTIAERLMVGLSREDFIPKFRDVITVGEFYGLAAGGQIIFT